ncbi:MAG: nicotinamide mononucleotide transporter [Clostridia bacterium]|nr:nicotinamide mononucleotide transporter [Clostridia bacterium]
MKITKRELWIDYVPTALAAVLIIVFAVLKEQTFLKTLPTLITLVVLIMSVRANRFAFLVGASNCVLYTIAYMGEGLYFSAASAFLVSLPIQVFSFFHWSRHKEGKTRSTLVRMKPWLLISSTVAIFPAWIGCYFGLSAFITGNYPVIDSLVFVLGILISALIAFRFVEGQYFNLASCLISLGMWIAICVDDPSNINFLIISCYNLFRTVQAAVNWSLIYKRSNNERTVI